MKNFLAKTIGLFILTLAAIGAAAQGKPNIVYIVSDDQGWKDIGYHGSDIKTPNLDRELEFDTEQ